MYFWGPSSPFAHQLKRPPTARFASCLGQLLISSRYPPVFRISRRNISRLYPRISGFSDRSITSSRCAGCGSKQSKLAINWIHPSLRAMLRDMRRLLGADSSSFTPYTRNDRTVILASSHSRVAVLLFFLPFHCSLWHPCAVPPCPPSFISERTPLAVFAAPQASDAMRWYYRKDSNNASTRKCE